MPTSSLPVINIEALAKNEDHQSPEAREVALQIREACCNTGFFYLSGHGINPDLQADLEKLSYTFFSLDENEKMKISMKKGGRAWRGYFPVEGELTSGQPDLKEGLYFGQELSEFDDRVKKQLPLHGNNLFPEYPAELKNAVIEYINAVTNVGHALMRGIALSLNLEPNYFYQRYTKDPLILFRIFHYPALQTTKQQWGVGEHTDYGVLTILKQDGIGGLQVKSKNGWIDAPPLPNTFVCNIGDMLDRMTRGLYRSTPHRVHNKSGKSRYSFPLFFDPSFEAKVEPIENLRRSIVDDKNERWDKESVHLFEGTYGDYLLNKIGRVFPELQKKVL